ncbi:GNAT family N-acetyltransferase [Roseofilum sp. BLCC_M154]|uniref:GNAT family N-acetyltransferase n=1 Tax=Roseofilum acuticapitatum BLCC-M154 TaxID=3022444 RepID=A0ABT7AVB1_9CYAN|nr:GNAT family N-acetyltransferase [Roseofilum acuticapitatum]MDJ1170849.1 GNAT family N-acetyltransferase [Roseofilum acuticapitatum BLCC-M154]
MNETLCLKQEHKATQLKIFLLPLNESHIQHLIRLAQEKDLVNLMGWDTFFEIEDTAGFITAISEYALPDSIASDPIVLGIYLDRDAKPIGYAVLKGLNEQLKTAEVGVAVLDRKYRNKGYGRLGLNRILAYAFQELGMTRIWATILPSNHYSVNMVKKSGFSVKELMPNSWTLPNGELVDMVWMEVTPETWRSVDK